MGCNVAQGAIVLSANGKRFSAQVSGNEKFTHELCVALKQGENPAEALLFLAELGAKLFHPENSMLGVQDRARWEELFGLPKEKELVKTDVVHILDFPGKTE